MTNIFDNLCWRRWSRFWLPDVIEFTRDFLLVVVTKYCFSSSLFPSPLKTKRIKTQQKCKECNMSILILLSKVMNSGILPTGCPAKGISYYSQLKGRNHQCQYLFFASMLSPSYLSWSAMHNAILQNLLHALTLSLFPLLLLPQI